MILSNSRRQFRQFLVFFEAVSIERQNSRLEMIGNSTVAGIAGQRHKSQRFGDAGAARSARGNASILSLVIAFIPAAHERLTNASGGRQATPRLYYCCCCCCCCCCNEIILRSGHFQPIHLHANERILRKAVLRLFVVSSDRNFASLDTMPLLSSC